MQASAHCRHASSCGTSTSGRPWSAFDCSPAVLDCRRNVLSSQTPQPINQRLLQQQLICCQRTSSSTVRLSCKQATRQRNLRCTAAQHSHGTSKQGPVIVIDNYDSFTYNLCQVLQYHGCNLHQHLAASQLLQHRIVSLQYLGDLGCEHIVYKNDEKTVEELRAMNPRGILLSPGPGYTNSLPVSSYTLA